MSMHPQSIAAWIAHARTARRRSLVGRRGRRFLPILAFSVVLASALPAMADATWQPLGALSAGTGPVDQPQVAVDASGDAVYVWEISEGTLCSGGPCERIQTRSRSAAGVLSPVQTISTQGQSQSLPHVAVDANGDAWFVWQHFDGTIERIQTRSRSAAGVWTGTATVSPPGGSAEFPQVAVDPSGNAVFTWEYFDGTHWRIQARTVSLAGTRSSTQTLSTAGQDALYPQVAVDGNGNAVFAWQRFDGSNQRIQARVRSAAGTLAATHTLSAAGQDATEVHVAVDPSGDAVFAWERSDGTVDRIQSRARSAAGTLSPTQTLGDTGTSIPLGAHLAVDPQGNAVAVWEHREGTAVCCTRVEARVRSADSTLGLTQFLSPADQVGSDPAVAVDPNGKAFAVWDETTTGNASIPDSKIHGAVGQY